MDLPSSDQPLYRQLQAGNRSFIPKQYEIYPVSNQLNRLAPSPALRNPGHAQIFHGHSVLILRRLLFDPVQEVLIEMLPRSGFHHELVRRRQISLRLITQAVSPSYPPDFHPVRSLVMAV